MDHSALVVQMINARRRRRRRRKEFFNKGDTYDNDLQWFCHGASQLQREYGKETRADCLNYNLPWST